MAKENVDSWNWVTDFEPTFGLDFGEEVFKGDVTPSFFLCNLRRKKLSRIVYSHMSHVTFS